ncbi:MAG: hypothetical protein KBD56_04300 [Candidatus Eisenbacteria bacterium]|nr:hypothetical protein [Candidatus Eisenbacteria bacterium]
MRSTKCLQQIAIAGSCLLALSLPAAALEEPSVPPDDAPSSVTVPFVLDHNRMLLDAEFLRSDGTWRPVRLWVDTGNPACLISADLARDLGIDLSAMTDSAGQAAGALFVEPPKGVRIGEMPLDYAGVQTMVLAQPHWLFTSMRIDANLPASVLKRFRVVFDYPGRALTLGRPGTFEPRGERSPAAVNLETGIVQLDAVIAGDTLSFALDNGASYCFTSAGILEGWSRAHPEWPRMNGALGCANIWGWWPDEPVWPVVRLPEIAWGSAHLEGVGVVGLPNFFGNDASVGQWYSRKTARPVDGFLGPNAFGAFRVEIDYENSAVYFHRTGEFGVQDMDLVGLTLRPEEDGGYSVIGVAVQDGRPAVEGVMAGDRLLTIDGLQATGATMGTVIDALRGKPGDIRRLEIERAGKRITVSAKVARFL